MMSLQYSRSLLRVVIAQLCQQLGWNAIQSSPLELLTNILESYVVQLGRQAHRFSELYGRTEPNLDDLGLAFRELHISLSELSEYVSNVDSKPFAHDVVEFPAAKSSTLQPVEHDPNAAESATERNDADGTQSVSVTDVEDGRTSPVPSSSGTALVGGLNEAPSATRLPAVSTDRRPFAGSSEVLPSAKPQRVWPDEAAHSQYEMRSFVRSDSGVLYPTGQGKLADPWNPVLPATPAALLTPGTTGGNFPGLVAKPVIPKPAKAKPKSRPSAAKAARVFPPTTPSTFLEDMPANRESNLSLDQSALIAAGPHREDFKARQTRLNAYDDAIESVLRKVQETEAEEDEKAYNEIVCEWGNDDEPFIPPFVAAGKGPELAVDNDERRAQIADTIDAVIARTFQDSDQSRSPPMPVGSPPAYEDEIIEVHSVSPLKVEVADEGLSTLPPPALLSPSTFPVRTLAERKVMAEERNEPSPTRRQKKQPKSKAGVVRGVFSREEDSELPRNDTVPLEIPSSSKFEIEESYVKLDELPSSVWKGRETSEEKKEEDIGDVDAAESLMKLAGAAPAPKRLRISYGSGRDRTVKSMRDETTKLHRTDDQRVLAASNFDEDVIDLDESTGWRPTGSSELLPFDEPQRSASYERSKSRSLETAKEVVESYHAVAADVEVRPAGKKGRSRKEKKKQGKARRNEASDEMPAVPQIPKMTIRFGGQSTTSSVSETAPGKLKLVIRPFASDSPSSSAKASPQQSTRPTKHRLVETQSYQQKTHAAAAAGSSSQMSPIRFTSSSSSSSSGSPYRDRSPARTPPPPSLAPNMLTGGSPRPSTPSPTRSSPSSTRSLSPPTLYRSPDVDEPTPTFVEQVSRGGRKSPPLPAFPSYPPSRFTLPMTSGGRQTKAGAVSETIRPTPTPPPPPSRSAGRSAKSKQSVVTETVSKIIDEHGEVTWICPACKQPDDGSAMIGCDLCDDWYHWPCVGIVSEPPEEEQWFCKRCQSSAAHLTKTPPGGTAAGARKKTGGGRARAGRKPARRR